MGTFRVGKHYKKWLKRIFGREKPRCQFNFWCGRNLIFSLKAISKLLGCPIYCVAEHCIELGLIEMATILTDDTLRIQLSRHLVENHLLLPAPEPSLATTHQARRIETTLTLIKLFEKAGGSLEEIQNIIKKISSEITAKEKVL